MTLFFPRRYAESREWFRGTLQQVQTVYPSARLESTPVIDGDDAWTIDLLMADATAESQRLFLLTTGLHGVEGYVGAALIDLWLRDFLPRLDRSTTGVAIVHPLNPWGMDRRRRGNRHNVDLNRNFPGSHRYDPDLNASYKLVDALINPRRPVGWLPAEHARFYLGVARAMARHGEPAMRAATLLGQYHTPDGLFYGGDRQQPEAAWMINFIKRHAARYPQVVLLDMHTGYGPRYQMSVVLPATEEADSDEWARRIDYPLVVSTVPDQFYAVTGDMLEACRDVHLHARPDSDFFCAVFEFGTMGATTAARLRSLRALALENQAHHHGANPTAAEQVAALFDEQFYPSEPRWRAKVEEDARRAFEGVLGFHKLLVR